MTKPQPDATSRRAKHGSRWIFSFCLECSLSFCRRARKARAKKTKEAAMRKRKERKRHDKLERSGTRRATRLFFIPLKINKFHKNVPCWLGVIFCRRLTTSTAFPFLCVGILWGYLSGLTLKPICFLGVGFSCFSISSSR